VTADGAGVVSHVGSRLLAGLADRSGLTDAFSDALGGLRERRSGHDPGRVLTDLAVLLADGGRSISDLAVLRDQPVLFGPVASTATAWRILDKIDPVLLNRLRSARAAARERLWAQRAETVGPIGAAVVVGPGRVCGSCSTPPWSPRTRTSSLRPRRSKAGSGSIR
jgi:hypothetical protein